MSTITITEDTGQFIRPDDTQGVPTIAAFGDGVVAARIEAEPPRQIDVELGLASS